MLNVNVSSVRDQFNLLVFDDDESAFSIPESDSGDGKISLVDDSPIF